MFKSIGDWAVRKTIKVQLRRLRLAIAADENGLDDVRNKISADVVDNLIGIFVKEHDILDSTLKEFFTEEQSYKQVYNMIQNGVIAKYGALAAWKAAGVF